MDREKAQIFVGVLSVVVNAVLFAAKFWAAMVIGSIALLADAWHTLSDSLSSIFVAASAKLQSKKPDKEHPFGHGRWELVSAIIVAFILGIIAWDFLSGSIERFANRENAVFGTVALVVTVVSIVVKEALAQVSFYLSRKTGNLLLKADGWHSRSDSLGSIAILIGILVTRFVADFWWMDSVLGMLCAVAIFYAGFSVLKDAISKILGEEPTQELIDKIGGEIKKIYSGDLNAHHFHLHNYISQKELTFHVRLDKNMTIEKGHTVATEIEAMVKEQFDMIATIHVEPLNEAQGV